MIQSTPSGLALSISFEDSSSGSTGWMQWQNVFKKGERITLLLEAGRVCMYGLTACIVCVCVWVYSRLWLLHRHTGHDKQTWWDKWEKSRKESREGFREIRRDKHMFIHALGESKRNSKGAREQGRGGRVGWGDRCTTLSRDNGENQRKEMPRIRLLKILIRELQGISWKFWLTLFPLVSQCHWWLFDTTTSSIDYKGIYGNISDRWADSQNCLPFQRHTDYF